VALAAVGGFGVADELAVDLEVDVDAAVVDVTAWGGLVGPSVERRGLTRVYDPAVAGDDDVCAVDGEFGLALWWVDGSAVLATTHSGVNSFLAGIEVAFYLAGEVLDFALNVDGSFYVVVVDYVNHVYNLPVLGKVVARLDAGAWCSCKAQFASLYASILDLMFS
jgi:hypothetical protein